ncbi:uncharacterized protein METZ01_LOCUS424879, partial [marine metagenome]
VSRESSRGIALLAILSIALPILSGVAAEEWKSSPSEFETFSSTSIHSGVYSPQNAFDYDWNTFALLEANRCDGGTSDCQEAGQPYAELEMRFPVAENTSAIDFHLQAVLHDG